MELGTQINRGVAWIGAAQGVIAVVGLVAKLVVMGLVTSTEYGRASAAFVLYGVLDYAADFGVTSALIARDDHTPERISMVFWFNVALSLAICVGLLIVGPLYGHFVGNVTIGWLFAAYGGKVLVQNVYAIPFALLRKELRYKEVAQARLVAHLAEDVALVSLAASGVTVWCWVLAALVRAVTFGVIIQVRHPFVPQLVFELDEIRPYVRFGIRAAASQMLYQLYTNLDVIIVTKLFGERATGIYQAAYQFVLEPVKTIANVVMDVGQATFARMRGDRDRLISQFIQFTRLNVIAVLPFVVVVLLVIPEFLRVFYTSGTWTREELALVAQAVRILGAVAVLRALGFLGPPLLDGIGRPDLTLRYMAVAAVSVPVMILGVSVSFSGELGVLAAAVGWAVGYPLAFAALGFLVVHTIDLPVGRYLRETGGMIGCCAAGAAAGFGVSLALEGADDVLRMVAIGLVAVGVMAALVVGWQKITPRSIRQALG